MVKRTYEDDEQIAEHADEKNEALEERAHDPVVARVVRRIAEHVVIETRVTRSAPVRRLREPFCAVPRIRLARRRPVSAYQH